ncbi:hypothetical protein ACIQGT_14055 [Streptomyces sp. NPDC093108]|uniref:hypothetical protein n=1 Tax=Streptomyces sp. NPDC093108 TaxID=3366030 RepID=UPI00381EDAE5
MDQNATPENVSPAQVGAGRTVHYVPIAKITMETLCDRTASAVLTEEQAAKKGKVCVSCLKALAAAEEAPVEGAPATGVEEAPATGAPVEEAPAEVIRVAVRAYRPSRSAATQMRALLHRNCLCRVAATLVGTFDNMEDARRCATERGHQGPPVGECMSSRPLTRTDAPAVEEATVEETTPTPVERETVEVVEAEEVAVETPAEGQVEVAAYTAALEQLYLNGEDEETRTLRVAAADLPEVLPTLRRFPRWRADQKRFTVNKVALIMATTGDDGVRVWVRGEAEPFRVDATGTPVDADAPAEPGPVDAGAVLAATRLLRRRREVQRVIDNRSAARNWNKGPATPTPAVEEPEPTPQEDPAPTAEEPTPAPEAEEDVTPQWRTLKGLDAPFLLYGEETAQGFRPASDRKQCAGEPLRITRTWMAHGIRYAEDADGRTAYLGGAATRYWVAPAN